MSVRTESVYTGEFLVSEGNNNISREQVALAANLTMLPGTVVAMATASGLFQPLDHAADDGTQNALGILYAGKETDATGGDGMIIARLAEVVDSLLIWPEGITEEQKTTAIDQLSALDIILRTE